MNAAEMIEKHHQLLALSHEMATANKYYKMSRKEQRLFAATRDQIFALRGEMNAAGVEWREPQTEWSLKNYGMLIV